MGLPDGDYTLQSAGHKPLLVYCANLNTPAPKEYLTLQHTYGKGDLTSNFSSYWSPGCQCAADASRHFEKVRIDLATLTIDPTDATFAKNVSTDPACWAGWASGMGGCQTGVTLLYAYASNCVTDGITTQSGDIDLRGLTVSLDPSVTFVPVGYLAYGSSTFSPDRKQVSFTGGGDCGWNYPGGPLLLKQD